MRLWVLTLVSFFTLHPCTVTAQAGSTPKGTSASNAQNADLRYIMYLERHGVRSPTGKTSQYHLYSTGLWPEWNVQPGYLTPHGYHLMELFGAFDRQYLTQQGLLQDHGCADASAVTIYTDSDQRTQETGKAIAQALLPECTLPVLSLPEGTNDPLFHAKIGALPSDGVHIAEAAIAGRIGGKPSSLTRAYYNQIAALDHILGTCGASASPNAKRLSLFDIPATLTSGKGDHPAELKGPLNTASTLAENLLLEYAQGMDLADVGWGCVRYPEIEQLMELHAAATDFSQRTPAVAKAHATNLLNSIRLSVQQAAERKVIPGAIGKPSDRVLFLVGHDTNQENVAGVLNLTWIIDGRRDDTPPGGAFVLELWQSRVGGSYSVKAYFTSQTLDQMRRSSPITLSTPPERVPVFIPGCSGADMSCPLESFLQLLRRDTQEQ